MNDLQVGDRVQTQIGSLGTIQPPPYWMPYKSYPDSAWKWDVCSRTKQSSWKRLSKPLPQKRRDELQQFWNSQTDIGLWISEAKRLLHPCESAA
ncbi:MAG: hypothetical protein KME43_11385 [Myxacorys chilensis ATA2-1-KO14]|jgi:hypothetical protein|nr:hypothetical protein [Myxacorys chilensis ATA2-1-KO14]